MVLTTSISSRQIFFLQKFSLLRISPTSLMEFEVKVYSLKNQSLGNKNWRSKAKTGVVNMFPLGIIEWSFTIGSCWGRAEEHCCFQSCHWKIPGLYNAASNIQIIVWLGWKYGKDTSVLLWLLMWCSMMVGEWKNMGKGVIGLGLIKLSFSGLEFSVLEAFNVFQELQEGSNGGVSYGSYLSYYVWHRK